MYRWHIALHRHGFTPCYMMGRAALNDPLCEACQIFVLVSDQIRAEEEHEAYERASRR